MTALRSTASSLSNNDRITFGIPLQVLGLSTAYAALLGILERKLPIKPNHIWAEVAGGVLISLAPIAIAARREPTIDWQTYEGSIWRSFIASGAPIIIWQLGEAMLRELELLRYTADRERRSPGAYADDSTALAFGGGN